MTTLAAQPVAWRAGFEGGSRPFIDSELVGKYCRYKRYICCIDLTNLRAAYTLTSLFFFPHQNHHWSARTPEVGALPAAAAVDTGIRHIVPHLR